MATIGMPSSRDTIFSQNHEAILNHIKSMMGDEVPV